MQRMDPERLNDILEDFDAEGKCRPNGINKF